MAEVEISYKGSNIATMNASGTKTLLTEAKYLEDDVTITYTRPAAPSGTKNISITQNGTTTEDVAAYASAEITANVPNSYSAGDEGKVVDNGALVAQGSDTVTQNDTYDTTLISSLTVNVSGGGGGINLEDVLNRTISGDLVLNVTGQPTPSNDSAGSQFYSATFNALFQQCPEITSLTINGLAWVPQNFMRMTGGPNATTAAKIERVSMPDALFASERAFYDCRKLTDANFPKMKYTYANYLNLGSNMFRNCYLLAHAEMGEIDRLQANMFDSCRALTALVLRKTSVVQLVNVNALVNTPMRGYGGTYSGHVYVPQDLIASYQAASNWSTLYASYSDIFAAIEGSPYENA